MGALGPPRPSLTPGPAQLERFEEVVLEKLPLVDAHGRQVQGSVSITLVKMGGRGKVPSAGVVSDAAGASSTSGTPPLPVASRSIVAAPIVSAPRNSASEQPNCLILVVKGLAGMHVHNFGGFFVEVKVISNRVIIFCRVDYT